MVAAFIAHILERNDSDTCIKAGLTAAQCSLGSSQAVPSTISKAMVSHRKMQVEPRELIV